MRSLSILAAAFWEMVDLLGGPGHWGLRGTVKRLNISYLRHRYRLWRHELVEGFDRRWGTETARKKRLGAARISRSPSAVMYWATPVSAFEELMAALPADPRNYGFIDFGCGKGRVVLQACLYPFRCIVGVEMEPGLLRVACDNFDKFAVRSMVCQHPRFECCRAENLDFDAGSWIAYFFNPFGAPVFEKVLARLEAHGAREAKPPYAVLLDPTSDQLEIIGARAQWTLEAASVVPANSGRFSWYIFEGRNAKNERRSPASA